MRIKCTKASLQQSLSSVGRVVATRTTLPTTTCTLLEVSEKGEITWAATNLEMFARSRMGGSIDWEGALTSQPYAIPYKRLNDITASMPTDSFIEIIGKFDSVEIRWGPSMDKLRSRTSIKTMVAEDFPLIPVMPDYKVEVNSDDLRKAIERVIFATFENDMTILGGVMLEADDGLFRLASTDRNRMAVATLPAQVAKGAFPTTVVPASGFNEMRRFLTEGHCFLAVEPTRVNVQTEMAMFSSGVLVGNYPDWKAIVAYAIGEISAEFSVQRFADVVRSARVVARGYNDYLDMEVSGDKIALSCRTPEGDFEAEVEAVVSGGSLVCGINAQFLYDWLNTIGVASGKMLLKDATSFAKLVPSTNDATYVFGLMYRGEHGNDTATPAGV